jgi:hypothetical protein
MLMECQECGAIFPSKSKLERHNNSKTKCTDRINTENFIKKSKEKFLDRFSHPNTIYINAVTPVNIHCNKCDYEFQVIPNNHLNGNGGCRKCSNVYIKSYDELIDEFHTIHGDKFIYDNETQKSYKNHDSIIKILCSKCKKYFQQSVNNHLKNEKCDNCEEELIKQRHQTKINSIDKNKKNYIHPKFTTYSINIETDKVTNIETKSILNGSKNKRGTTDFSLKYNDKRYTISLHRFKYEAVYNEIISDNYEIDHINQNPKDNSINNLQCLSRKEHGAKTQRDNPDRSKKSGKTQSSPGTAYNPTTKSTIKFESIVDLSKKIGSHTGNIHRYLRTGKSPPYGYSKITFDKNIEIEGEEWKEHPSLKVEVSNMGRIKDRRRITYGTLDGAKEQYYMFSGKKVHQLVMDTWGEKPIDYNDNYTIDHINMNSKDNRVDNLRYATKSEQCLNQRTKILIKPKKINGYTGEIIETYNSLNELKEKTNMNFSVIHNITAVRREWFINLNPIFLNRDRLNFVRSIFNNINKSSKDICGLTETKTDWIFNLKSTKFKNNQKLFKKCKKKLFKDSYNEMKDIAIKNNNARIIQCYFRSYIRFKNLISF